MLTTLVQAQRLEERLVVLHPRAAGLPVDLSERGAQVSALAAEAEQADGESRAAPSKAADPGNEVSTRE